MVDMVVHRHQLRATLSQLCRLLTKAPAAQPTAAQPQLPAPASA
jgi:acetyl-CoA carboxylase carboxyl transferase subunit beta